jgi:multisite-specific tRNA:(cytosine-C5)-methyltransferase
MFIWRYLIASEFELVDVGEKLPELKRRPGLTSWRPTVDRKITTFSSYQEFLESMDGANMTHAQSTMTKEHWPPPDAADLGLARWSVVLPDQLSLLAYHKPVLQHSNISPFTRHRCIFHSCTAKEAPTSRI